MHKKDSRRKFIKKASLTGFGVAFGPGTVLSGDFSASEVVPHSVQQDPYQLFGKHQDMVVLNDKPWNMEASAHILDDRITTADKMFVRNNGILPVDINVDSWLLKIVGESALTSKTYSIANLKSKFESYTYQLTIECGGNGRNEFDPPAKGNQWTVGAVSCAEWTGVRLKDLLEDVGIKDDAVYIGYYGEDIHLSGDRDKKPISRGIPLSKALEDETIIAYAMNGEDIPMVHGFPLRLVVGGYPGSASGKWLSGLSVRNRIHDGAKMAAPSYSVPKKPVAPGEKVAPEDMIVIEEMPVKSLITFPKSGAVIEEGKALPIRGHAWTGYGVVTRVDYSLDFGATWKKAILEGPVNKFSWQHFQASIDFPKEGYYEIWAAATDERGNRQPMLVPGWNPKGYLNNACHRIAVKVVSG